MFKFFAKLLWYFWELNYYIAKKAKIGYSKEDFVFFSVFLTSLLSTVALSSLFFFLQIEKKYQLDVKIISVLLFIIFSAGQLLYLFNRKKRFMKLKENSYSLLAFLSYFLILFAVFLLLGISMIYDFFDGNFNSFINFIFKNYLK